MLSSGYNIVSWIDQYASKKIKNIDVKHLEDVNDPDADIIIIVSPFHFDEMTKNLKNVDNSKIQSIYDFLKNIG